MDMLWYLKSGEAPKADMVLGRLSEAGICLLTGETENLVTIPVDMNTNNMLPTNMACVSKQLIDDIKYTYRYKISCYDGIRITLNTAECFVDYNKKIVQALFSEIPEPKQHNFISIYEFLMTSHVKGVDKITFADDDSCMDWLQLQRYWFTQVEKLKSSKLKIITNL